MNQNYYDYVYVAICNLKLFSGKQLNLLKDLGLVLNHREFIECIMNDYDFNYVLSKTTIPNIKRTIDSINSIRENIRSILDYADIICEDTSEKGIFLISTESDEYPFHWKLISGMPNVFFCIGKKSILKKCNTNGAVAIVGSRYPSQYSKDVTKEFTAEITNKDVVVVSGMALGIDGIAHATTLQNNKSTIAVVPGGCDVVYPHQNYDLYQRIIEDGLVISELIPGTQIIKQYFPSRNRLIAGLSDCCMIMEAGASSGTLHTASFAANQGKNVYVLPNTIYSTNSLGGLALIRDGAKILLNTNEVIDDIAKNVYERLSLYPELLDDFAEAEEQKNAEYYSPVTHNLREYNSKKIPEIKSKLNSSPELVTNEEFKIIIKDILTGKSKCMDELIRLLPINLGKLSIILTEMEISGEIYSDGENYCSL